VCWTTPLAVTKAFNAHLTGVTFVQNKPIVGPLFDGATMITVHEYRRELQAAADAAEVRFRMRTNSMGSPPNPWFSARNGAAFLNSLHALRGGST
jgi:hypothetical protein